MIEKKLFEINGRKRDKQIELATKYNLDYPNPAGGCLLCERGYCKKLKELMKLNKDVNYEDIKLLKVGRHFFEDGAWLVLGRDEEENDHLFEKHEELPKIIPEKPGPLGLIKHGDEEHIDKVKVLINEYSKHDIQNFNVIK